MKLDLTNEDILKEVETFNTLYGKKPLGNNDGGMKAPHMLGTFCMVRKLNPVNIIESGVWFGQGSWMLRESSPDAKLYCIEPRLEAIKVKVDNAKYYKEDFSNIDWSNLDKEKTLVFFDDHQNGFERIKQCHSQGFKHLIF